jgi:hypothetical protein
MLTGPEKLTPTIMQFKLPSEPSEVGDGTADKASPPFCSWVLLFQTPEGKPGRG